MRQALRGEAAALLVALARDERPALAAADIPPLQAALAVTWLQRGVDFRDCQNAGR
jgi:hypothetical protein